MWNTSIHTTPTLDNIRDMFDHLFIGSWAASADIALTLQTTGLEWLARLIEQNKRNGLFTTQRSLQDLVELSFFMYMSLKQAPFPIAKNVVLPTENGSYKFIVAGVLPFPGLWKQPHLLFKATHDGMHKAIEDGIRKELSLQNESQQLSRENEIRKQHELHTIWWGRIDINHDTKTLTTRNSSGHFGSLSNELVTWFLQDKKKEWYEISVDMDSQRPFASGN